MKKNPSSSPINSRPSHTTWTHWERRKSRQHRASAQPSPPQFLHNTKRRRSSPLDVTRLWSDKTDPPPSLPPGVAWLPLRKLLQSSQLSWPEAAREEIPPSLMGGGPAPGNSTKAVTRAGLAVCELTHREHSGYLLLPFFPAILFS